MSQKVCPSDLSLSKFTILMRELYIVPSMYPNFTNLTILSTRIPRLAAIQSFKLWRNWRKHISAFGRNQINQKACCSFQISSELDFTVCQNYISSSELHFLFIRIFDFTLCQNCAFYLNWMFFFIIIPFHSLSKLDFSKMQRRWQALQMRWEDRNKMSHVVKWTWHLLSAFK